MIPAGDELGGNLMNAIDAGARELPDHLHAPLLHAGFWQRFAAYLIDAVILVPALFVLEAFFMVPLALQAAHHKPTNSAPAFGWIALWWLSMIVLPWLYFALCESSKLQATPGKLALGLRVTDVQGRRVGFGKATGRWFGKLVSGLIFNIGYMMAGWTARKQALHDMMANCCVVRRDALVAFERSGFAEGNGASRGSGMPGWAVALIVLGTFFVVVIPTVAILAAIAIPAYQDYVIRTQALQGVTLAESAKTAVAEYAMQHDGQLPADNAAAGLTSPDSINGNYVTQIEVRNGEIIVTYGNHANMHLANGHLLLQPQVDAGYLRWSCGSDDIPDRYLPMACRANRNAGP